MLNLTYLGSKKVYEVEFSRISSNIVQVLGDLPFEDKGFNLSREGKKDPWDYPEYTTLYREIEGGLQFSSDGSVYIEPQKPEPTPEEPYVPTLEEAKASKIAEMEAVKQAAMDAGINVTLADSSIEHFSLEDKEQKLLMALQVNVAAGDEKIPWHTSDETEHCKYYSNADMRSIITEASMYGTYHETYIRDIRIYINSLEDKESVEAVYYGMVIPEKYRSEVLQDIYTAQQGGLTMEAFLFVVGGRLYTWIEILWRGFTHWTMFILGGACFVVLGLLNEFKIPWHWCLLRQSVVGACVVTVFEFITGCIVNLWLGWDVWDYSDLPFNLLGQICLYFFLLWIPLCMVGIVLDDWIRYWRYIFCEKMCPWKQLKVRERPHYKFI